MRSRYETIYLDIKIKININKGSTQKDMLFHKKFLSLIRSNM